MEAAEPRCVEPIAPLDAKAMLDVGGAIIVDVREPAEVQATGTVPGALHIPRAMIEAMADPSSPSREPRLSPDTAVILYCASGKRSELAGETLIGLGYRSVFNLGGLKDWIEAGLPVET
jgi:rhodanese-related sulfurtransferase